jgi:hypothetical protein
LHYSLRAGFGVLNAFDAARLAADWLRGGYQPATVSGWYRHGEQPTVYTVSAPRSVETRLTINMRKT